MAKSRKSRVKGFLLESSSPSFCLRISYLCIFLTLMNSPQQATGCYTPIFAFGDSLTDAGNYLELYPHLIPQEKIPHFFLPPNGDTYFHHPTGRCCDGRLMIDFFAEYFGLPHLPTYFGGKNKSSSRNFEYGVNFAVVGSPVLDISFYEQKGMVYPWPYSMKDQLNWFKDLLPILCRSSSCNELKQRALVIFGPFGANDYNNEYFGGTSREEIRSLVPLVAQGLASAELIEAGMETIMVPGMVPDGCLPQPLSSNRDHPTTTGCIGWLNDLMISHNKMLQKELDQVRNHHPHASIIYADYYNSAMQLYHSAQEYGFNGRTFIACCGGGGPYNYNFTAECGDPLTTSCLDPSIFVNWDGAHFTEAANRWMSKAILEGPYTFPRITTSCISSVACDGSQLHTS
ncbi:hypothetical protein ACH5RR_018081 [Cinchona calisaya]|uniref:Uncharacterized protein n=1 Tax=Cinchona calisaya TaxID=153742 RepID=A0ABD2ZP48_9GENT